MSNRKPRCPIRGCANGRRQDCIMCADHWSDVPRPLRDAVYDTRLLGDWSREHMRAIREAIASVQVAPE